MRSLTVLKLGGSLLTDKSKPYTLRREVLVSVVREIKKCMEEGLISSLVVVHGVGSFGHPPVIEHKLHKGFQSPDQLLPLAKTQSIVNDFRLTIAKEFQAAEIPVNLLHPSSMVVSNKMRMEHYFLDALKGYLGLGMPILIGGDMVFDQTMGFSVGSGDQLAVILARELGAKRLIFAMDVDGIYGSNPTHDESAELLSEISIKNIDQILKSIDTQSGMDASGAMLGKIRTISVLTEEIVNGLDVVLISMMEPGRLEAVLEGKPVKSTRITY